jgi:micrococcal nuclease
MSLFYYNAEVVSVYDGDTLTVNIDVGFKVKMAKVKIRLLGVNTPEMRGGTAETKAAARKARDYVRELCLGKTIRLKSEKKGKYGRYLATIWTLDEDGQPHPSSINQLLIIEGLAESYII